MKQTGLLIAALGIFLFAQEAMADWTVTKNISQTSGTSFCPAIAADSSGNPHVVWQDSTSGHRIYYNRSMDGGASWATRKNLTWGSGYYYDPSIAIDSSDTVHVVFTGGVPGHYEIYYKKSTDMGVTWSATYRLCKTSGDSWNPAITADSSNALHVGWNDGTPGNNEIYYRRSAAGGLSWNAVQRITWNPAVSLCPRIAIDLSNHIHVVWMDTTPDNYRICYKRSSDAGVTWAPMKRLTWTSGEAWYPTIAVDSSGDLHVVWNDDTPGNWEIYYKRSTDGGATWTANKRLTWNSDFSWNPAIAADSSDNLHVVWMDDRPGNYEIYYMSSADGGSTWTIDKRLTWNSGLSMEPDIVVDSSDNLHMAWYDYTPGNADIYYKKYIK